MGYIYAVGPMQSREYQTHKGKEYTHLDINKPPVGETCKSPISYNRGQCQAGAD